METLNTSSIACFVSYAHNDDKRGQIAEWCDALKDEYITLTGSAFRIYRDKEDLKLGNDWQESLDRAVAGSIAFLPVISPSYLQSENCRQEFNQFQEVLRQGDRESLLIPVMWAPIDDFRTGGDEIASETYRLQHSDWTELRLGPLNSPAARVATNQLARRIAEVIEAAQQGLEFAIPPGPSPAPGNQSAAPGILDIAAAIENADTRWSYIFSDANASFRQTTDAFISYTERLALHPGAPNVQEHHSLLAELASQISIPLRNLRIASEILKIDLRSQTENHDLLAASIRETKLSGAMASSVTRTAGTFGSLAESIGMLTGNARELSETIAQFRRLSREFVTPASDLNIALRHFVDSATIVRQWADNLLEAL
ncbi:toll/interleukin-1 receptor domain-containing protein [Corynebacterium sp.]|uniref:toll/interleukin-1 receptor domain-containing protein n=1 Tax=Corynebacterium sp. TaxID=1720 RepID=UPI0026E0AA1F|nr:toll/interleukin-1 receptor domain-containing protein [Corynebacterium sp.]MDO5512699.1 toll/interleukin-1 receptor domain-containing protein [Corynebacterium sp.]